MLTHKGGIQLCSKGDLNNMFSVDFPHPRGGNFVA